MGDARGQGRVSRDQIGPQRTVPLLVAVLLVASALFGASRRGPGESPAPLADGADTFPVQAAAGYTVRDDELELLARTIAAEAEGEPYIGQVAVGAVILNRVRDPRFPNTISGVIYQPHAFESVSNGLIWRRTPSTEARRAAQDALNGWDPTYGSLFFWNPYKPVSAWIWSRPIVIQYGNHVFAR